MFDEDKSVRCEEDQCEDVKRCRDCGVAPGQTHYYWCRYYPSQTNSDWHSTTDDENYRVYY